MFNESSLGKNTKHEKYRTLFASEYQMADNLFGKTDDRKNTDFQMEEMTRSTQNTKTQKWKNTEIQMAEMTSSTLGRKARPAPEPEIIYVTMVVTGSLPVVAGQLTINVCVTGDGNNLWSSGEPEMAK